MYNVHLMTVSNALNYLLNAVTTDKEDYNAIVAYYDAIVEDYDAIVAHYDATVEDYDAIVS